MGSVIAGISSGLEEQNVLVTDLVSVRAGFEDNHLIVNNRYTSTLSGVSRKLEVYQVIIN